MYPNFCSSKTIVFVFSILLSNLLCKYYFLNLPDRKKNILKHNCKIYLFLNTSPRSKKFNSNLLIEIKRQFQRNALLPNHKLNVNFQLITTLITKISRKQYCQIH